MTSVHYFSMLQLRFVSYLINVYVMLFMTSNETLHIKVKLQTRSLRC